MKQVLIHIVLLVFPTILYGQCQTMVNSTDGYNVDITLTPVSLSVPSECPFGYNFNVVIDYDISFSGNNIPANLYTLQGTLDCNGSNGNYFPLPNNGGIGSTLSATASTTDTDCGTATPGSRGCNNFNITIGGPGIPNQIIQCGLALPVEFGVFSISLKNEIPTLEWTTYSEIRNDHFEILHSPTGNVWKTIGSIPGAGNSTQTTYYEFEDHNAKPGYNYYRLKQVDSDGTYILTDIRVINLMEKSNPKIYPNPFSDIIHLENLEINGEFKILDVLGKDVTSQIEVISTQIHSKKLNLSRLHNGIYTIVFSGNSIKLVKT
ncbi:MAG: T9SS type A sorting domain-containing protein [Saprospiraceae bacterium]|nr:T9SS type A sorting domain-containing protein [Saprospiraceae bacterium]